MNKIAPSPAEIRAFRREVYAYYRAHPRSFPWRETTNPYRILVSEIMLQQTQVERVRGKFVLFCRAFPTLRALARATPRDVLRAWQGLGYNRRALALHAAAREIVRAHRGRIPCDPETLSTLPGIGLATASAICAYAFNLPVAYVETNIRTVIIHHFFTRRRRVSDDEILAVVTAVLDRKQPREWYSALMDYGAFLKQSNPRTNSKAASYRKQSRFKGSLREARGMILKLLMSRSMMEQQLAEESGIPIDRIERAAKALKREGFIRKVQKHLSLIGSRINT